MFEPLDFTVVGLYLAFILYIGLRFSKEKTLGLTYEKSASTTETDPQTLLNKIRNVEDRFYSTIPVAAVILVWIFFA
jgi:hypothetical protein